MKQIYTMLVVFICSIIGAMGQICFSKASKLLEFKILSLMSNWWLVSGLFLYGIATLLYIYMLRFGELSTLYPIISFSYLFTMIFGLYYLGENVTPTNIVGSILLIASVSLMIR